MINFFYILVSLQSEQNFCVLLIRVLAYHVPNIIDVFMFGEIAMREKPKPSFLETDKLKLCM